MAKVLHVTNTGNVLHSKPALLLCSLLFKESPWQMTGNPFLSEKQCLMPPYGLLFFSLKITHILCVNLPMVPLYWNVCDASVDNQV